MEPMIVVISASDCSGSPWHLDFFASHATWARPGVEGWLEMLVTREPGEPTQLLEGQGPNQ